MRDNLKAACPRILWATALAVAWFAVFWIVTSDRFIEADLPKKKPIKSLAQLMPQRDCNHLWETDKWTPCMLGETE